MTYAQPPLWPGNRHALVSGFLIAIFGFAMKMRSWITNADMGADESLRPPRVCTDFENTFCEENIILSRRHEENIMNCGETDWIKLIYYERITIPATMMKMMMRMSNTKLTNS